MKYDDWQNTIVLGGRLSTPPPPGSVHPTSPSSDPPLPLHIIEEVREGGGYNVKKGPPLLSL